MFTMIVKMSGITILYILLTIGVWLWTKNRELTGFRKLLIGLIFGISSVLSTHFGISYGNMVLNVRDLGPLSAGLFFSPASGIIAGLIGGIERYIAGTYFGVGSYTRIACSISTCLAGFVAMGMNRYVFKGKKPSPAYAFFMGAVMEVFHMYVVFISHRGDMRMAFYVVSTCAIPMIIFTGIGLALSSVMLKVLIGEWRNPFEKREKEEISISYKFQIWLFVVMTVVSLGNSIFHYMLQTQTAFQDGCSTLEEASIYVKNRYFAGDTDITIENGVDYDIVSSDGRISMGRHGWKVLSDQQITDLKSHFGEKYFTDSIFTEDSLNRVTYLDQEHFLLVSIAESELYWNRNAQAYENAFGSIVIFSVVYVLISLLVNQIVVNNINLINRSLKKITNGDLDEEVEVRSSSEFASLSDDINQTVDTLKRYIDEAEKRIEQELILARTIQESALPKNFHFPARDEFDLYASMNAAKEVGGDFYDFFFVDKNRLALVIADVSGKGIPASLFMMRSKTAIRSFAEAGGSPAEIMFKANNTLCEGNEAEMFVTVWLGIIDLESGRMVCANAGHEYPVLMRAGGDYELYKDKHSLPLAAMENMKTREYELVLNPGDRIFVYTDGVPEAINEEEKQYGTDRLLDVLNHHKDDNSDQAIQAVAADVNAFKGEADQFDDITMLEFVMKG